MISAEWHPDEERLLSRYVDGAADQTLDQHLEWCRMCAQRATSMTGLLEAWRQVAVDQADDAFDDARLTAQRRGIQQRLGAAVPARVLPFPVMDTAERHAPLARVAAAVLLVALTGAGLVRILQMPERSSSATLTRAAASRAVPPARQALDMSPDVAVLEDIDMALLRPRTAVAELRALDEFTPHVRDLVAPRR